MEIFGNFLQQKKNKLDRTLPKGKNEKVIGLVKDELIMKD